MEILESAEKLENFIIKDHYANYGVGWYYKEKALIYINRGYEAVFTVPDWEELRLNILRRDWVKTAEDVYEAFQDAVYNYKLFSRG